MSTVGFVVHPFRPAADDLAEEAIGLLARLGHRAYRIEAEPDPALLTDLDLVVSLGGDGTMLRAVGLVSPLGVPVLGVNLGHLGYLTVVEPDGLKRALQRFLDGEYRVEERMTLDVRLIGADTAGYGGGPPDEGEELSRTTALNDVVLQRPAGAHAIRAHVVVNGKPFVTYAADSVIVATPTGSTAYNLSARGPIVSPTARVQVVTPVAPHSLFDRSLVLDADERVSVGPIEDQTADLVVDGRYAGGVKPGEVVRCCAGEHDARFVTFGERDFQDLLKRKFHLGLP